MKSEKKFRHEFKYVSPEFLLSAQEMKISSIMQLDSHVGESGCYAIRSVYFDDLFNTCYYENENGTDPREKFRIRIYNCSKEKITLELKQKESGKCHKMSCKMPLEICEAILQGKIPEFTNEMPFLLKKFLCQMQFRGLRPVVIVAYERVPFVYEDGNVRVTFDRNLRSSDDFSGFFREDIQFRPIWPAGTNMMEVKFDEFLPDFINEALQTGQMQQTSFSKYYLCRKFDVKGLAATV